MVIYEVNLTIDDGIYEDFMLWLSDHVNAMLRFSGFIQAGIFKQESEEITNQKKVTIQYQLESRKDLERYFTEFAAKMREEGIKLFRDQFSAARRVFEVMEIISK